MTRVATPISGEQSLRIQTASDWFTRHESGIELSPTELKEWDAWLANERNGAEYDQFLRMHWQIKSLPVPRLPTGAELRASPVALAGSLPIMARADAGAERHRWRNVRRRLGWISIAACVAGIAAAIFFRLQFLPGTLDAGHSYATAVGEQRDFTLKDGSVVTLAGASSLTVTFTASRRTATLNQGEARFRVQHDRWRPFTVLAGAGTITAVGTVFDVRRYSSRVVVVVSEGAVEVAPQDARTHESPIAGASSEKGSQWAPLRVAHGQEMTYDFHGQASAARPTDVRLTSSWTEGAFVYRARPLREVIEDVQRYSKRRIVLDSNAAELEYTGTFIQRQVDQWLRGLTQILPLELDVSLPDFVVIRSRLAPQQRAAAGSDR